MQPIPAKYAGVCARTGQRYQAGDLIVKLSSGKWALAQDKSGHIKVAPDWRLCRLPDCSEKQINVNLPSYCRTCIEEDGHPIDSLPKDFDRSPYRMTRLNDSIACTRCGRTIQIIPQAELDAREREAERQREEAYRQDLEQNLHLVHAGQGFYTLSHRLPREMWDKVAQYFTYWSHDDLDEMDYFDMPGGYYVQSYRVQTTEILNGAPPSDLSLVEKIEAALQIRPENRLAVLEKKWEEERRQAAEAARRQREFEALGARLFNNKEGEYLWGEDLGLAEGVSLNSGRIPIRLEGERVDIGAGQSLYGTGEWFVLDADGKHIWHVRNNGMDGDNWSYNNIVTGGAGGIGHRFEATPERREFIERLKERKQS